MGACVQTVLFCAVLCYSVLYFSGLCYVFLFCAVFFCSVPFRAVFFCAVLYWQGLPAPPGSFGTCQPSLGGSREQHTPCGSAFPIRREGLCQLELLYLAVPLLRLQLFGGDGRQEH